MLRGYCDGGGYLEGLDEGMFGMGGRVFEREKEGRS
jgi:hypothetical protein